MTLNRRREHRGPAGRDQEEPEDLEPKEWRQTERRGSVKNNVQKTGRKLKKLWFSPKDFRVGTRGSGKSAETSTNPGYIAT